MSIKAMVMKEERVESILHSLKLLDYLTSSQIREIHDLKSQRNTSRVLNNMEEYLNHFRDGENIYYLSAEGRDRVDCEVIRRKTPHIKHFIMRNQLYIYMKCPSSWINEPKLMFKERKDFQIQSDASFINGQGQKCFVEIDNTQKMVENRAKIKKYKEFISSVLWAVPPLVVWVTTSEIKRKKLIAECQAVGVPSKVYTLDDII